jgi:hypothetical protein
MRSPFLTAVGAGAGTLVTLGAATCVVSGVALTVTKRVVQQRKVGLAAAAASSHTPVPGHMMISHQGLRRRVPPAPAAEAMLLAASAARSRPARPPPCLVVDGVPCTALQMKAATDCLMCKGARFRDCQVCMGEWCWHCMWCGGLSSESAALNLAAPPRQPHPSSAAGKAILRCRQPVSMKQLQRRSSSQAAGGNSEAEPTAVCSCPACGTTRLQRCLNCLGEGKVCLPS